MTRNQLICAVLATVCWGSYIVVAKVASSQKYCNVPPRWTTLLMGLGIASVFVVYWLVAERTPFRPSAGALAASVGAGLLWAAGMVLALLALRAGADVARLVPLYNANTLVALVLAIGLLGEIPATGEMLKVGVGSLLVVVGGLLVAR